MLAGPAELGLPSRGLLELGIPNQIPGIRSCGGFEEAPGDQAGFFLAVEANPEHGTVEHRRKTARCVHHGAGLITKPTERSTHARTGFQRTR